MAGRRSMRPTKAPANTADSPPGEVRLLSGGNPQIQKADGDAPVQAYIAAMPEWKSDLGRRLDDLIVCTVPDVRKAVRWNSPWYGVEGQGWFASFHVFAKYVKLTFLNGASLDPLPPGSGKDPHSRWIDIYEGPAGRGADGGLGAAVRRHPRLEGFLTGRGWAYTGAVSHA